MDVSKRQLLQKALEKKSKRT